MVIKINSYFPLDGLLKRSWMEVRNSHTLFTWFFIRMCLHHLRINGANFSSAICPFSVFAISPLSSINLCRVFIRLLSCLILSVTYKSWARATSASFSGFAHSTSMKSTLLSDFLFSSSSSMSNAPLAKTFFITSAHTPS